MVVMYLKNAVIGQQRVPSGTLVFNTDWKLATIEVAATCWSPYIFECFPVRMFFLYIFFIYIIRDHRFVLNPEDSDNGHRNVGLKNN